jgi:hypothetical protein
MALRSGIRFALSLVAVSLVAVSTLCAQQVGGNVNMVTGTSWPGGDPFLQRQNEPSMAVSSRNPLHMIAGANDYRSVDLPFVTGAVEPTGDAWLGLFKSFDGGQTWTSTLVPGYPQDRSLGGLFSPIHGLGAGADPTVRAGTNGMLYYSGVAFNRQEGGANKVFVATYTDDNNLEGGDSIRYLWTTVVDTGTSNLFEDKPSIAVDIPRSWSGACIVPALPLRNTQIFRAGTVYAAWTQFTGDESNDNAAIQYSRSIDCGLTWKRPVQISGTAKTNQGAALAIDPNTGALYITWRVFASTNPTQTDAIMYAASFDGGSTFTKPTLVANINPFDQGEASVSFRTNDYPAIAVDAASHVYIAWSQRNVGNVGTTGGDARVIVATGMPTSNPKNVPLQWGALQAVDPWSNRGHQIIPAMAFSAGKLTVAWYDLRNDDLVAMYTPLGVSGQYSQTLENDGGGSDFPAFGNQIQDPTAPYSSDARRQTLDVRSAQAMPGNPPTFFPSVQVSDYPYGSVPASPEIQQLQVDPPNLPMFQSGTLPFFGDYIDVAGPTFIANSDGTWRFNNEASDPDFTHVVWADNRDVVPPADGNWANYTPPTYGTSSTSIFDPTQQRPACTQSTTGNTGDRNQNIYTAQLAPGVVVSTPGNAKQFGTGSNGQLIQRQFAIVVANTTNQNRYYQVTVDGQPSGGAASFLQFPVAGQNYPLTQIEVQVPALSSTSRGLFVSSTNAHATVTVSVAELTALNGTVVSNGETGAVTINGDPNNPPSADTNISTTETYTPTIATPNIANPNIANPNIANPNIANPNIANPNIANPNIANPNIANPNIANPNIANPNIANPNIANTDLSDGTITDGTWAVRNTGNTSSAYAVNLAGQNPPPGVALQLIVYQNYTTPLAQGCTLSTQSHFVPVANITNVTFATLSQLLQPAANNPTIPGLALAPGQTAYITLRVVDSTTNNPAQALLDYNPITQTTPIVVAQGANTGKTQPPVTLTILTKALPQATLTGAYPPQTLQATGGSGSYTWSLVSGTPPTGIALSAGGVLSGTLTGAAGTSSFTVQVKDAAGDIAQQALTLVVNPVPVILPASLPAATQSAVYSQTFSVTPGTGTAPFTWSAVSLPSWLTFNSTSATLSGTPPAAGSFPITIKVRDANGVMASPAYTLLVKAAGVAISTSSLPNGQYNSLYTFTPSATGGTAPYIWSVGAGGILPVGMTLRSGTISGTPAQAGQWSVPLTVTDSSTPPTTQTTTLPLTIGLATGYAGGGNCYMPYPTTPLYFAGASGWTLTANTSPTVAALMSVIQGNVLTGCLTGLSSGSYTLTFNVSGGPPAFAMPLFVVGQDTQDNGQFNANSGGIGAGHNPPPYGNQQGVVTPGQTFSYVPGPYGADAANFSGDFLFGFNGGAPQNCGTASGLSNGISLTAPQPGRYDIVFDGTNQTCPVSTLPTTPAPIVINSVDAVGTTVTFGVPTGPQASGETISNVSVSSSNPNAQTQQVANVLDIIQLQSVSTIPVGLTFNYAIWNSGCPGCIDQIEVGLNTDSGPQLCAYSGIDGPLPGVSGSGNVTINVPNIPGRYYVGIDRSEDFSCLQTTTAWWNGPPSAPRYIAVVDVWSQP